MDIAWPVSLSCPRLDGQPGSLRQAGRAVSVIIRTPFDPRVRRALKQPAGQVVAIVAALLKGVLDTESMRFHFDRRRR